MAVIAKRAAYITCALFLTACAGQSFPEAQCERVELSTKNAPVVSVEDMAFDAQTNTLYLSAYDRRTHAYGGLYRLNLNQTHSAPRLGVTKVKDSIRPHGIDLARNGSELALFFLDRKGSAEKKNPIIGLINWHDDTPNKLKQTYTLPRPEICASNDILYDDSGVIFISQDHESCTKTEQFWENIFRPRKAKVIAYDKRELPTKQMTPFAQGLSFANGLASAQDQSKVYVAQTRGRRISIYSKDTRDKLKDIHLAGGPDNLTRHGDDIYAALIPSLIRFSRFQKHAKKRIKSRFAIITQDQSSATYDVPADIISGATVAIKAGAHIWLGAAYDTAIARCTLPEAAP